MTIQSRLARFAPLAIATAAAAFGVRALADSASTSSAFAQGQQVGTSGMTSAKGSIATGGANVPNYTNQDGELTPLYGNGQGTLGPAGTGKEADCATRPANPSAYWQQECDAVNYLANKPPNKMPLGASDPIVTGSAGTIRNPGITTGTQDCHNVTTSVPATYKQETCEQAVGTQTYTCTRIYNPICSEPYQGCAAGGVVEGSFSGGFASRLASNSALWNFGADTGYHDNTGYTGFTQSGSMSFTIQNLSQIGTAVLSKVTANNTLRSVDINGVTVYTDAPDGGRVLQCGPILVPGTTGGGEDGTSGTRSQGYLAAPVAGATFVSSLGANGIRNVCSDKTAFTADGGLTEYQSFFTFQSHYEGNPSTVTPNTDIRRYLHEGVNTIKVQAAIGGYGDVGGGEAIAQLTINQICTAVCTPNWDDQCTSFEQRAAQ
ncbi:hypothetical protein ACVCIC_00290 [Burkholderia glumae]|uniref:hypothetical protein n=1 Tax=Burkholderia glumae TaxID=337 RepID=UPI001373D74B|nr:hypothetical protein [Burkholderia glumae]MCM2496081.1 hypothetical protein [Burkholderia glumae]NVE26333.1 hypothetical protein [Burkholderia glumae]QHP94804.1 hypothetical protein EXE55_28205 [Burkholderia glumae]QKM51680.1 hypothetical protein B7760_05757 [Burkholderia glumae]